MDALRLRRKEVPARLIDRVQLIDFPKIKRFVAGSGQTVIDIIDDEGARGIPLQSVGVERYVLGGAVLRPVPQLDLAVVGRVIQIEVIDHRISEDGGGGQLSAVGRQGDRVPVTLVVDHLLLGAVEANVAQAVVAVDKEQEIAV